LLNKELIKIDIIIKINYNTTIIY